MSDNHIAVKIDGVIYVKLDDVKPMRARIEKLEAALREIKELHHGPEDEDVSVIDSIFIRDDRTYKIVCDTLEELE